MKDNPPIDQGRRGFLLGKSKAEDLTVIRPPWSTSASLATACTGCNDCITACPPAILSRGDDGYPQVSFAHDACDFCGECARVCPEDVFANTDTAAFAHVVKIESTCLMQQGVECRSCADACTPRALSFNYQIRPAGGIQLDQDSCNGCGACLSICPVAAIRISNISQRVSP